MDDDESIVPGCLSLGACILLLGTPVIVVLAIFTRWGYAPAMVLILIALLVGCIKLIYDTDSG